MAVRGHPTVINCLGIIHVPKTQWYRVFSDFWVEQYNQISWSGNPSALPINLIKSYQDGNYSVILQSVEGAILDSSLNGLSVNQRFTTYFTVGCYVSLRVLGWIAFGY